jgi:hypothetical protein
MATGHLHEVVDVISTNRVFVVLKRSDVRTIIWGEIFSKRSIKSLSNSSIWDKSPGSFCNEIRRVWPALGLAQSPR